MKTTSTSRVLTIVLVALTPFLYAQENETQLFMVHEDDVILSEWDNYWKAAESMKQAMTEHNISDATFYASSTNDGRFLFVSPIENHGALDHSPFETMAKKMGEEKMESMFKQFDGTYSSHRNYLVHHHPNLSYKEGESTGENNNYRVWLFHYFHADKHHDQQEIMKEWKALNEKHNVQTGYSTYTGGIGMEEPVTIYMFRSESPEAFEKAFAQAFETMGEDAQTLWAKNRALLVKSERVEGWFHPELSYTPETEATVEVGESPDESNN